MQQKGKINFGFRGWMLIIFEFTAFIMYGAINQFGQNIHANFNSAVFGWNAALVSTTFTIAVIAAIVIQFIWGDKIANARGMKWLSLLFMVIATIGTLGMILVTSSEALWIVCWMVAIFFSNFGSILLIGVLIGQWFPRRKGTVMGIATLAFPIVNGFGMAIFAPMFEKAGAMAAWIPWLVIDVIGIVLCLLFVKDYPEECGCFPDNNENMTAEEARAIMEAEKEAKKNSVWKLKNMFKCPDFWLLVIPQGVLLMAGIGIMTQIMTILNFYPDFYAKYGTIVLLCFVPVGSLGSFLIGLMDTRVGTKAAILLSCGIMLVCTVLLFIGTLPALIAGLEMMQLFVGASSNFEVSSAAQYWRREDFPTAYSLINPVAGIFQAFGPMIVAVIGMTAGFKVVFGIFVVLAIVSVVMILIFKPKRIADRDLVYRREAGLPDEGISKSAAEMMGEK